MLGTILFVYCLLFINTVYLYLPHSFFISALFFKEPLPPLQRTRGPRTRVAFAKSRAKGWPKAEGARGQIQKIGGKLDVTRIKNLLNSQNNDTTISLLLPQFIFFKLGSLNLDQSKERELINIQSAEN
jgi:hypothetical protein